MRQYLLLLLAFFIAADAFAEKKDFKGLFGSYRRERFTENEGNSTDFGMDLSLSTLLPVQPLVQTNNGSSTTPMNYATFFNVEMTFFVTLSYNFEVFANVGYDTFNTRLQLTTFGSNNLPLFQQYELEALPAVIGVKYRLSREDIVPYFGAGVGMAYVHQKATYDYAPQYDEHYFNCLAAEVLGGFEFFFSAKAGLRMEVAAFYLGIPANNYQPGGSQATYPSFAYQANPISIRYSSGVFFMF